MGRTREFTEKERRTLARLSSQGVGLRDIAKVLKTSPRTLRRRFPELVADEARSGPTPMEWSQEQRDMVQAMVGFGLTHTEIASVMQISTDQLKAYFPDELEVGVANANARVASSLFQMATQDRVPSAAIFWLKARAGWKDHVHVSGGIEHHHEVDVKTARREAVSQLDPDGRAALRVALGQLGAESPLTDEPPGEGEPVH